MLRSTALLGAGALTVGVAATVKPVLAIALGAGVLGASLASIASHRLPRIFLSCAGVLLTGYAFLGRGFSYLGVPPLYVGEMALAVGVAAMLFGPGFGAVLRSPLPWLWFALALCGAAQTIPYLGTYGVDAVRDAAVWGYGIFALAVATCLARTGGLQRVSAWYGRWLPWFVCWVPIAWGIVRFAGDAVPQVPGSTAGIVAFNAGDAGVHLGGIAVFLLLGLRARGARRAKGEIRIPEALLWALWFVAFSLVALESRGGGLAALLGIPIALTARPRAVPKVALVGVLGLVATLVFTVFDISIDTGKYRGKISPAELAANMTSAFRTDREDRSGRDSNREWRLQWWNEIVRYTIHGDRFWTGKGFGINLADDDGFQVNSDGSLRSPHNGHLTFLARAGVPGLTLWILLQIAFGTGMVRAYLRARRAGAEWWQRLDIWILAYWLGFLVNGAFDVFLERPQGGIWFWCLFGVGLWAIEVQRALFAPAFGRGSRATRLAPSLSASR
jgi:hypothetical protein